MSNYNKISNQRGTLLVEAIAMLGLIALVTPTLYKKSAERLQEIQDINTASQARTMYNVVETFMKTNYGSLVSAAGDVEGETLVIPFNDNDCPADEEHCYSMGYSAFVPFGYAPGDLKNYGEPRVYIHKDNSSLVSYIVFPANSVSEVGKKRAARVASLVGANGGVISKPIGAEAGASNEIFGTGGAWYLDADMIEDIKMQNDFAENSLVITSPEPINMSNIDSEKFLYRTPPDGTDTAFHNTMVTDLYLGGNTDDQSQWQENARKFYSIFNARKVTLNTTCRYGDAGSCDPNVADLYIGKPDSTSTALNDTPSNAISQGNNGAAWIYGNLTALGESFRVHREGVNNLAALQDRTGGYDVIEFGEPNSSSTSDDDKHSFTVFRAENSGEGTNIPRVALINDFVQVSYSSNTYDFKIGNSSSVGGEGAIIHAYELDGKQTIDIGTLQDSFGDASSLVTRINRTGGTVWINGGDVDNSDNNETVINDAGGKLLAGHDGGWLRANGNGGNAQVHLLGSSTQITDDERVFSVGHMDWTSSGNMVYGDNKKVALRGGKLRVHSVSDDGVDDYASTNVGGRDMVSAWSGNLPIAEELSGETAIITKYTDILGSIHLGSGLTSESPDSSAIYTRRGYTLGVAGKAWIDDLYAPNIEAYSSSAKEFHAGYPSHTAYHDNPHASMLNVYDGKLIVRDRNRVDTPVSASDNNDNVLIYADSTGVWMRDLEGSKAEMTQGTAVFGRDNNQLYADSSAVNVIGSSLANIYTRDEETGTNGVVNIQNDALRLVGQPVNTEGGGERYGNTIEAMAQEVMIRTKGEGEIDSSNAQFYMTGDNIRTRYVDFTVENSSSSTVFKVRPDIVDDSSAANVFVDGSLHVKGNEVIHIASNAANRADNEAENRAMLEVDPYHLQIWARNGENYAKPAGTINENNYYAMLKVNPSDIAGGSSAVEDTQNASIYMRRGAIELEKSEAGLFGDAFIGADQGVGYIKANRLVSDTGLTVPEPLSVTGNNSGLNHGNFAYDQYMVNPAYTSVMHDIKLTTRGGARLSDALPDFVLKGVYNLINSCQENDTDTVGCPGNTDMNHWADPYIGYIPYASCPPGYRGMATIVPISFSMGQAGQLIRASEVTDIQGGNSNRWVVNPYPRQAKVLAVARSKGLVYPTYTSTKAYTVNKLWNGEGNFSNDFSAMVYEHTEGWFQGFEAVYDGTGNSAETDSKMETDTSTYSGSYDNFSPWLYSDKNNNFQAVAEALYFQQNNWLKTSLIPGETGWAAYMGFLYNVAVWGGSSASTVRSNYNEQGYNDDDTARIGGYAWNVFPIPTNTLEGHATVYCYFDRSKFSGEWAGLVDQRDSREALDDPTAFNRLEKDPDYVNRLNDPSLKYNDPW